MKQVSFYIAHYILVLHDDDDVMRTSSLDNVICENH